MTAYRVSGSEERRAVDLWVALMEDARERGEVRLLVHDRGLAVRYTSTAERCECGKSAPFDGGAEGICECCSTCATPDEGVS